MRAVPRQSRVQAVTLGVGLWLALCGVAAAGPDEDTARELTRRGHINYNLGHYLDAVRDYEEAYRLVPDPTLLYNVAQAYRQAGKLERALNLYRTFLREAPPNHPSVPPAKSRAAQLDKQLADT